MFYETKVDIFSVEPLEEVRCAAIKRRLLLPCEKILPQTRIDKLFALSFADVRAAAVPGRVVVDNVFGFRSEKTSGSDDQSAGRD